MDNQIRILNVLVILFLVYCYLHYFPLLQSDLFQSKEKRHFSQPKLLEESDTHINSPQTINHGFKKKKPDWVIEKLIELKVHFPKKGCRKIAAYFNQQFEVTKQMTVSKTYVANILKEHAYDIHILRRQIKNKPPILYAPKTYYGLDLTYVTDTEGKRNTIFGLIDFHSRVLLGFEYD